MKNFKKILLIPICAFLLVSLASAQDHDNKNTPPQSQKGDRENDIEDIFGKVSKENLRLYTGFTNNPELNQKIKALRDDYKTKIEALRNQYLTDFKNLIKDQRLLDNGTSTNATSTNSSSTNATNTRPIRWSDNSQGLHLGFWKKVKNWLGFNH